MPLVWTKDKNLHHAMYMSATELWSFRSYCSIEINRFRLVGFFGEKPFLDGLVDQLFQPHSNQVETVEKAVE